MSTGCVLMIWIQYIYPSTIRWCSLIGNSCQEWQKHSHLYPMKNDVIGDVASISVTNMHQLPLDK